MGELNEQEYDMTKKMLDTLRNGSYQLNTTKIVLDENFIHQNKSTQGNSTKVLLDEHDMTKKMLDTIRGGCKLISEAIPGQDLSGAGQDLSGAGQDGPDLGQPEATEIEPEGQVKGAFPETEGGKDIKEEDEDFYNDMLNTLNNALPGRATISSMKLINVNDMLDVELIGAVNIPIGGAQNIIEFSMSITGGLRKSVNNISSTIEVRNAENGLDGIFANFQKTVKEKLNTEFKNTKV